MRKDLYTYNCGPPSTHTQQLYTHPAHTTTIVIRTHRTPYQHLRTHNNYTHTHDSLPSTSTHTQNPLPVHTYITSYLHTHTWIHTLPPYTHLDTHPHIQTHKLPTYTHLDTQTPTHTNTQKHAISLALARALSLSGWNTMHVLSSSYGMHVSSSSHCMHAKHSLSVVGTRCHP